MSARAIAMGVYVVRFRAAVVSGQARVRGRRDRPRDRFEKVLEWTHGGLIVEQYRTALLNLVPDVRSVVVIGG